MNNNVPPSVIKAIVQLFLAKQAQENKEKSDVVHPLFKLIAEGDAKGITELLAKSDNPKHILTNLVPLSKVPAKITKRADAMGINYLTPFHAAVLGLNTEVLQVLVDKALELRIFQECSEGSDLKDGDQKETKSVLNRPMWFALACCWYRGADILFKAGSSLFPPDDRNPVTSMMLFIISLVTKADDVVTLEWMMKRGLGAYFGPPNQRASLFHMAVADGALGCMQMAIDCIVATSKNKNRDAVTMKLVNEVFEDESPLVCSMRYGKHTVMRWLLLHGAHKDLDKAMGLAGEDHVRETMREMRQQYLDSLLEDA